MEGKVRKNGELCLIKRQKMLFLFTKLTNQ